MRAYFVMSSFVPIPDVCFRLSTARASIGEDEGRVGERAGHRDVVAVTFYIFTFTRVGSHARRVAGGMNR